MISIFSKLAMSAIFFLPSFLWAPQSIESAKDKNFPFTCEAENNTFLAGEELVYRIYYNLDFIWLKAGEVKFNVGETADKYIFSAEGHTYKSYEWFYKVRDFYRTEVDKKTLLPLVAEKSIAEGGYRLYERVEFDHDRAIAKVTRGRSQQEATYRGEFDIPCVHDMVGLLYGLRTVDRDAFRKAGKMPVSFFLDMKNYDISLRYIKSERKKIKGLGRYNTIQVIPDLVTGGVFQEGSEMKIWVSDDLNNVPLMIESPVSVGTVKAVLKSHSGLKHNLVSE